MQKYFVTVLIIVIIMVLFAVFNTETMSINFGFTEITVSKTLALIVVFTTGALLSILVSMPNDLRRRKEIKKLRRELDKMKKELENKKNPIGKNHSNENEHSSPNINH